MKRFNTTGPCFPEEHYMLPAIDRLPGVRGLVARGDYFVVHAPRQTGKTTAIQSLAHEINAKGDMFALYCTLETLQNRSAPDKSNIAIRDLIAANVEMSPFYSPVSNAPELKSDRGGVGLAVRAVLQNVCRAVGKPVAVFFDEADCLVGDALISFLSQLRDGYVNREMALGQGRLDLCVEFRGSRYVIEVKTSANFQGEKSYLQCAKYLDSLGLSEGWMPIFEKSKDKSWDEKIYSRDEITDGKTIHVIGL